MGSEWVIVGYGILGFLSLYLFSVLLKAGQQREAQPDDPNKLKSIEKKIDPINIGMQILFMGVFVFCMIGMAKGVIESYDNCGYVLSNQTVSGSTTSYAFTYSCSDNSYTEDENLYEMSYLILYVMIGLLIVGFIWNLFLFIKGVLLPKIKGGFKKR